MSEEKQKEAVVLYSGGLDSRLTIMLLQDQGFKVTALYFNLPYGCGCCNVSCNFNFTQREEVKMKIIDVTKEPYLSEYLEVISNPKYGRGTGMNPCKDCKIYIFLKAKEYADENGIEVIASGEVLDQRPMSQTSGAKKVIDNHLGFEILRPLSAKLLPETSFEKKGLVNREKLEGIQGRTRKRQMELAEEYKIKYPSPGGGCFLCEKEPSKRLKILFEKKLVNENTLQLSIIGRHFMKENIWYVVARNLNESMIINNFKENSVVGMQGEPSVYFSDITGKEYAKELQKAYKTGAEPKIREIVLENKLQ